MGALGASSPRDGHPVTGYVPKPGDRVRATRELVVERVDSDSWILPADGAGFFSLGFAVELVEAALVPFVVGGPITPEMGEPPASSIVSDKYRDAWQRRTRGWFIAWAASSACGWQELAQSGPLTLLRLGDGSTPS